MPKYRESAELEPIPFDEVLRETESAWLFLFDLDEVWLPKSQCVLDEDEGYVYAPVWLAKREGLL